MWCQSFLVYIWGRNRATDQKFLLQERGQTLPLLERMRRQQFPLRARQKGVRQDVQADRTPVGEGAKVPAWG